jgi:hypothetical protein
VAAFVAKVSDSMLDSVFDARSPPDAVSGHVDILWRWTGAPALGGTRLTGHF